VAKRISENVIINRTKSYNYCEEKNRRS